MAAAEAYELELFAVLLGGLEAMGHVTAYGKAARRTATAYFTVAGHDPRQVAEHLAGRRVNVWNGHNYAWELTGALAIRDAGSARPGRPGPLQHAGGRRPRSLRGRGRAGLTVDRPGVATMRGET
jgi:selenocysteine lyase/cysteine desulfurase